MAQLAEYLPDGAGRLAAAAHARPYLRRHSGGRGRPGLAVVPYLFCAKHLSSGRLVSPFPALTIRTGAYSLLLRDRDDEVVRKFAAWLQAFQV